jgi:hypothetical protein
VSTKLTHFLLQFADPDADGSVTGLAVGSIKPAAAACTLVGTCRLHGRWPQLAHARAYNHLFGQFCGVNFLPYLSFGVSTLA